MPLSDLRKLTVCAYRDELVQDWRAHDLVIRTVDCLAITTSQVPDVVQEWREPSHREFRPRNLWSLFNAFTEFYKSLSPMLTPARSEAPIRDETASQRMTAKFARFLMPI